MTESRGVVQVDEVLFCRAKKYHIKIISTERLKIPGAMIDTVQYVQSQTAETQCHFSWVPASFRRFLAHIVD